MAPEEIDDETDAVPSDASLLARMARWCRRSPRRATSLLAAAVVGVFGLVGSTALDASDVAPATQPASAQDAVWAGDGLDPDQAAESAREQPTPSGAPEQPTFVPADGEASEPAGDDGDAGVTERPADDQVDQRTRKPRPHSRARRPVRRPRYVPSDI